MRKSPHASERENHERWLVSYADFITLLFAFFVVLYASSQVDKRKMSQVAAAIQGGFQQLGVFPGTRATSAPPNNPGASPLMQAASIATVPTPPEATHTPAQQGNGAADLSALKRQLEEALREEIKKHRVEMRIGQDGLIVSLREIGFFDSGDDSLLPEAQPTLARIATILGDKGFHIRVEGHTDNVPIHNAKFKSNWELSTARATEVVWMLTDKHGLDPHMLSVAGYSEYRPVAGNETVEGRRMNRRVDLVIVSEH